MSDSSAIGRTSGAIGSALEDQYKALQRQQSRHKIAIKKTDPSKESSFQLPHQSVNKQQKVAELGAGLNGIYKPIFNWKETKEHSFYIVPTEKNDIPSFLNQHQTTSSSNRILSLMGYKINITEDIEQFKQKLQKYYIESKSHNRLIGTFSELKFGLVSSLLTLLGVDPITLEKLKKDALKAAINDNIQAFEQNEYNAELLTIFTKSKKDNGRVKVLTTLRKQLIKQMQHYGQPDYYTKERIYDIQKNQVKKILDDLLEEQQNLMFLRNFQ